MLPKPYSWIDAQPGPKMLKIGAALYGLKEIHGKINSPVIMGWAHDAGYGPSIYPDDETAWCGLFMDHLARTAGYAPPSGSLSARAWAHFGNPTTIPMLGDVVVLWRGSKSSGLGHVGLYVGETKDTFLLLGGNERDQVNVVPEAKYRLVAARRPPYKVQPPNVRRIFMGYQGPLSTNEA